MVRGREGHLGGVGRPSQGHQQEQHHPHPGAEHAGIGDRYALLKIV